MYNRGGLRSACAPQQRRGDYYSGCTCYKSCLGRHGHGACVVDLATQRTVGNIPHELSCVETHFLGHWKIEPVYAFVWLIKQY